MTDQLITEKELDQSREYIENLIRLSPDIICVTNFEDGEIIEVNKGFCNLTGWSSEEVIGKTTTDLKLYTTDFRNEYVDMIIKKGEINGEELLFYKKNREPIYVLASSFFIDLFGHKRLLTIARDITERKHTELLLKLESKCYQIDSSTDDFKQTLIEIIKEIESHYDLLIGSISLRDHSGKYLVNTISPGLPQDYLDAIEGVEIGEGVGSCGTAAYRGELVIVSDIENDELWKDYRDLASQYGLKACWSIPIKSNRQDVIGTFAGYYKHKQSPSSFELMMLYHVARIVGTIVEQNKNDEILKESREKFRTLYDDTPAMFFSLNMDGMIISVNNYGARYLGYDVDELIDKNVLSLMHKDDRHTVGMKLKECFSNP